MLTVITGPRASGKTEIALGLYIQRREEGRSAIVIDEYDGSSGWCVDNSFNGNTKDLRRVMFRRKLGSLDIHTILSLFNDVIIVPRSGDAQSLPKDFPEITFQINTGRSKFTEYVESKGTSSFVVT